MRHRGHASGSNCGDHIVRAVQRHAFRWRRRQDVCFSEGGVEGSGSRFSVLDKQGNVLSRFPIRGGHGSWVDAHGDIYVGLPEPGGVDKYVRKG